MLTLPRSPHPRRFSFSLSRAQGDGDGARTVCVLDNGFVEREELCSQKCSIRWFYRGRLSLLIA